MVKSLKNMGCAIFVTVRTTSKRLPKKALLKIGERPLIKILIDRISTSKKIKKIIVCTTTDESDDELCKYLIDNKINVFRGDNEDILNRIYRAAKRYKIQKFVVVEGDDLFCEPLLIDKTYEKLCKSNYDFLYWENLPFGVSPLGIKTSKLQEMVKKKTVKNTETGWGKLIMNSGVFKIGRLRPTNQKLMRPEIRLTIDYAEDLKLAKLLLKKLQIKFKLYDVIKVLDDNPKWVKINEKVKEKYTKNFENQFRLHTMKGVEPN